MPFSPKSIEEKPYNQCVNCAHIGKNCDGPNFLAMEMHRLSEWCRLRKEYLHNQDSRWTNAYIAEQSGISKVSVDRFLSGNVDDIKTSTIARILKVLVNGTWGQYPCTMAADNPELVAQYNKLQIAMEGLTAEHNNRIDYLKEQMRFKDNLVIEYNEHIKRKNRVIRWLSILLGVSVILIIAALVVDAMNPDKGFFWLASAINGATNSFFNNII